MNILVTGCRGQLGRDIQIEALSFNEHLYFYTDVEDLDICKLDEVEDFVKRNEIDCIVNCAGYTAVDKAEEEVERAYALNAEGVKNLALISTKYNAFLLHISTDYVFSGEWYLPWTEEDAPAPFGVYGKSKLAGEEAVKKYAEKAIMIRTSWLYSMHGNNFVKTMLRLGKERESLSVVFDQVGTPTYAKDLAKTILYIIGQLKTMNRGVEIYNYSNEGVCSWYDFAVEIMKISNIKCEILPIESKEYPTATKRPPYSVLNKNKIKKNFNIVIPHWTESLQRMLETV